MNFWSSLTGALEVKLTGADVWKTLADMNSRNIPIAAIRVLDPLTIRFHIPRQQYAAACIICESRGDVLQKERKIGAFWTLTALRYRPMLLGSIAVLLALSAILPARILFIRTEGNNRIPEAQILECAEASGIRFGALRKEIRSEKVKNALVAQLPELQWVGINTYGCTAVISVREKPQEKAPQEQNGLFGNMIAVQDGIISSCTATQGTLLCSPGQAVTKGEVLISGYTDCGLCIRLAAADGEVFAKTRRSASVITPSQYNAVTASAGSGRSYSLLIGKKRINLWKNSRIYDNTCGRIYMEKYLTLPGSHRLPIAIAVEEQLVYITEPAQIPEEAAEQILTAAAASYLKQQMAAGTIIQAFTQLLEENAAFRLAGHYDCHEMIGRFYPEQIGDYHGKTD